MNVNCMISKSALILLCIFTVLASLSPAQKKPKSMDLDVDADDMRICAGRGIFETSSRKSTRQPAAPSTTKVTKDDDDDDGDDSMSSGQLCVLFRAYYYNLNSGNLEGAMYNRNDMIDLVVGQIDTYYKLRKDGRKSKIRVFETILDFLRIGGELAVTIMNGERAKTIIGASLAALDTSRTKFEKNFEILATQVLINNMTAKRARILTEITVAKDKPVRSRRASDAYSWNEARNDLRDYLIAGTFDDALDTLVKRSGNEVVEAENLLRAVSKKDVSDARAANDFIVDLDEALKNPATEPEATRRLRLVVATLSNDPDIAPSLSAKQITAASTGRQIWDALFIIRGDFVVAGRPDLSNRINQELLEASR